MEFKGTKGKWKLATNDYGYYTSVRNLDDTRKICVSRVNDMTNSNANMLLISKAPCFYEELKETIIDLKILRNQIALESKYVYRWQGMPELIDEWINRKEQLIKETTEL